MPGSNPCPLCVELGLIRRGVNIDGFRISQEQYFQVPLQTRYSIKDIQCMQKDCENLYKILKENPKEILKIFQLITNFKLDKIHEITQELNLNESNFHAEGGGMIALFAAIVLSGSAQR